MPRTIQLGAIAGFCALSGWAQTTQGIIAGQALDKLSGVPLSGVTITCSIPGAEEQQSSDSRGFYTFPLLSP